VVRHAQLPPKRGRVWIVAAPYPRARSGPPFPFVFGEDKISENASNPFPGSAVCKGCMNFRLSIPFTAGAGRFGRLARLLRLLAMALFLGSNPELRAQDANSFRYFIDQNSITITGYTGAGGAVTIPANLNGLPVTRIGDYSFFNRRDMTQITLPDSLTTIGRGAFFGCTSLTLVNLPNSLTTIGVDAFYVCRGLTQITFPESLTSIGEYAFYGCTGLRAIDVASANPNYSSVGGVGRMTKNFGTEEM